jgi:hypothetical protein
MDSGTLKPIGNETSSFKIGDVATKCRLVQTDNGLKVDFNYTGPNASAYLQYVEKHREELTEYLLNPDVADYYEWMELSHQTPITLKRHEKETLVLYIDFDPITKVMEAGISDENITMKLGAPLIHVNINEMDRNVFKLNIYNMLLLADEIAIGMGNEGLRKMANIEMVKTYLTEIYDKYHDSSLDN